MCRLILILLVIIPSVLFASNGKIYVDGEGVLRERGSNKEVSFYGVNYTVPFAHAYRALGYLGVDRKEAIDRDTYHFARLGFNAFRIHIWDVEISDESGNLIENDHLNLLDYLIYKVEQRGISVVITAQTNFGNGYPEKNIDTGGYSYKYGKCEIHDNEKAISAQERYLKALAAHKNPYTGKSYSDDDSIIAMEINNEPCHSGDAEFARKYVNRMIKALKKGGFDKPILYNVSHNFHCTQGFFDSSVQGTTYQWYPLGLVAGHCRKGNFLPNIDSYDIPFSDVRNFNKKAKFIYEFDPADNLYTYLYPATVRSFRKAGFQWITQFTYDPIDMAWANTEYQTHFMNLAYTPGKAISMKIAAEVARKIKRGADFGKYPNDTIFGDFQVSYKQDLSVYNSGKQFFYTNNTSSTPKSIADLEEIAGCGNSSVVKYSGTGAYFLDKVDDNTWRLEVMPDVVLTCDPFEKPSLSRKVGRIIYCDNKISIDLPSLGSSFNYKGISEGNARSGHVDNMQFDVYPGVYLLSSENIDEKLTAQTDFGNIKLGEYVAPDSENIPVEISHFPQKAVVDGDSLTIRAKVVCSEKIDSVLVYPSSVSFWADSNTLYPMSKISNYEYETKVLIKGEESFRYNIVVFSGGKSVTYPNGNDGTPLDWDYENSACYTVDVCKSENPVVLFEPKQNLDGLEAYSIPEGERYSLEYRHNKPVMPDYCRLSVSAVSNTSVIVLRKYLGDLLKPLSGILDNRKLCVRLGDTENIEELEIGFITTDGAAYSCRKNAVEKVAEIGESEFVPSETYLCPTPFPAFLNRKVRIDSGKSFDFNDVEFLQIVVRTNKKPADGNLSIEGIWLK